MEIHLEAPTLTHLAPCSDTNPRGAQASATPNPQPPKPGSSSAFDSHLSLAFRKAGQGSEELIWKNWRKVKG